MQEGTLNNGKTAPDRQKSTGSAGVSRGLEDPDYWFLTSVK
mgnify:CR=1 FL=1